jgi:UDP-perosamine 4-acetyltransferase
VSEHSALNKAPTILIYGAGGHAKVVLDAAQTIGLQISLLLDDAPQSDEIAGVRVHNASGFDFGLLNPFSFIVGIGANVARSVIYNRLQKLGRPINVVHPFCWTSPRARIGNGVAILAGVVINIGASIDDNVIVNTGASIDHDCSIASHSHICPGVRLAGAVTVGERTMVGTGAIVIPGVSIGANCIIGAGSTVVHDIPDNSVALGSPARVVRSNSSATSCALPTTKLP